MKCLQVIVCAALVSGIGSFDQKLSGDQKAVHALNRLTFGARPGEVGHIRSMGVEKWIDQQLHPERISENPALAAKLQSLETLQMTSREMVEKYPIRKKPTAAPQQERTRVAGGPAVVARELMEAKLHRAILSNRQLEEVLTDFWFNHFNVYLRKGADRYLVTSYERDAIRPHVLGKFQDMLLATAQHPAMLFYLDNWQSIDPQALENMSKSGRGRQSPQLKQLAKRARGLNENYGRELLELHTLGVEGGYTQQDVMEVARCFTGWTIRNPRQGGDFQFAPLLHDRNEKTVLGQKIAAGGGEQDGRRVIEILSKHPSTARFLSTKLAQRFVADQPPQALVDRMAATFLKTDGDLRQVMKTMISSREFFSRGAYQAKMKSPLEMVVSSVRAVNADVKAAVVLASRIEELGQPLYRKEEPTGYPNTGEEWVNSSGLLGRMNFAAMLTAGKLRGIRVDMAGFAHQDVAQVARGLLQQEATASTREAIAKGLANQPATPELIAGLVLGSPDFQRR